MDNGYFQRNVDPHYTRRVYNCFLNSAVSTQNTKNREFTCLDLFPTTLAAMGCTIEGERLGLGTNLFSGLPTLAESMGFNSFNSQVSGNSEYYSRVFRREDPTQEGAE
jgi:phosphoglycerol transferase